MKNTKQRAAFFDLDGTLIRKDSQTLEAVHLLKQGPWSPGYVWGLIVSLAVGYTNLSMTRKNELYLHTCRGRSKKFLKRQGEILFERAVRPSLVPAVVERLEAHRSQGDLIVLVSATTTHLLEPIRRALKPDVSCCTRLQYDDSGICLGKPRGPICADREKVTQVKALAARLDLDLTASSAYSDHESDIPFLESVGRPVAVNPTPALARHAQALNWPVIRA